MHKIFGTKENVQYSDREGAYLIPTHGDLIGVVQTPKGYFLLGGGLEDSESHADCIRRECLEEVGCTPIIEDKLCSAETYVLHPTIGYFHPIQTYYVGKLSDKVAAPTEADHVLCWKTYGELKGRMFSKMQGWALEQAYEYLN